MASTPPPVPTQNVMTDSQGLASRPWIAWFTTLGQLFGFNQVVQSNGTAEPAEIALNFLSPLIVTDNPGNGSTDISLPAGPSYSIQFGDLTVSGTGGDYGSAAVVFPTPFAKVPKVFTSPTQFPRSGIAPMTCYPTNVSANGFNVNLACAVPTGGGGDTIDHDIVVDWVAIG